MQDESPGRFSDEPRQNENTIADEPTQEMPSSAGQLASRLPNTPGVTVTASPLRSPKSRRRKLSPLRLALIIFGVFVLLFGGTLAAGYMYYVNTIQKPVSQFIRPVSRSTSEPTTNPTPGYDSIKGRSWNILLLGSDNDQKFSFPAVLTQVMMIVHIDTQDDSVSMVSIPRDSWVAVPDAGMHKIDQAFLLGASGGGGFEGGVRLARATVEKAFGITIDRYAWVGLDGFAKVIDTLGGVDVDVTHPIVDDNYPNDTGAGAHPNDPYSFKRVYIAAGPQHLNGEEALEYVRSRHADQIGDIGRTQRQQQVLEALKQKLTLSSIVNNLPTLIKDLNGKVYTDLNEQEMLDFANFGRGLSSSAIQRVTLGPGSEGYGDNANVYDASTGTRQDVIIPHCEKIQPILKRIFGAARCDVTG
ncbi:MAG: LCP family protein [Ktedonobacteraceae bacterium]|nr:LCP family protein [Ktedonobacteraceae bacterium]